MHAIGQAESAVPIQAELYSGLGHPGSIKIKIAVPLEKWYKAGDITDLKLLDDSLSAHVIYIEQ